MRSMGIAELKAQLSETLAKVKAGDEILVTEHGRPIAKLAPLSGSNPVVVTKELVRTGLVKAPEKRLDESFWKLPRAEYVVPPEPRDKEEGEAEMWWELREAV
jgi:prevent-host-death family protein